VQGVFGTGTQLPPEQYMPSWQQVVPPQHSASQTPPLHTRSFLMQEYELAPV